jgi:peroxiredoxin Q/BCP
MVAVGSPAPDFTVLTDEGKETSLRDYRGHWVVLYFYPKADTPGWTKEACAFRDAVPRFEGLDAVILGDSPDSVEKQAEFKKKYNLPFTLLADKDHKIAEAYGAWQEKSMMGKKYMGVVRSTVIIDPQGKVARVFEKVKDAATHPAEVGDALTELESGVV